MRSVRKILKGKKSTPRINEQEEPSSATTSQPNKPLPEMPFPQTNSSGDRVFPIKNLKSNVDLFAERESRRGSSVNGDARPSQESYSIPNGSEGSRTPRAPSSVGSRNGNAQPKVSARSQFIDSKSGPPGVLQGIDPDLNQYKNIPGFQRCEDEPIHIPGAIQNFGALIALKYNDLGDLEVRIASENTRRILGYGPEQLFAMTSFLDALKDDIRDEMIARINNAIDGPPTEGEDTRLDVFKIILTFPYEPEIRLWCAIHLAPKQPGLVICEFEEYFDAFFIRDMSAAMALPQSPISSMEVTPEELKRSTTNKSKPLAVIDIARQRKNKELSSLDLFNAQSQAQHQIAGCTTVQSVMDVVVGLISQLTGLHRVMFYRFDGQKNGRVDAELLNPNASTDVWLGLNYPATDIPRQARELYKINRIRVLQDRDQETSRLVCRSEIDSENPLDLTHSCLRSLSPIHLKYLENMGVRSTMTISIVINKDLWGLVACHGYGDQGTKVSLPVRELCRNIGEFTATKIQQLTMQQRIDARRAPTANPSQQNAQPISYVASSSADLLKLVDADFALLSVDDDAKAIGRLEPYPEAIAITSYLQTLKMTEIRSSCNINADFPQLAKAHDIQSIAGLLVVPLNFGGGSDFMVFFRRAQSKQVKWAGNPHEKEYKPASQYLEPRSSFARWVENITGTSREWTDDQLDTASVLGLVYGRFIEVWKQKGSAKTAKQIAMIRASSRELRTPLNAVVNYLEMALENKVDNKTRHILDRAQEASFSLTEVMDDLLKLTKPEDTASKDSGESFNLNLTVSRAMKGLQKDATRKSLTLTVALNETLPSMVKGDPDRLKEALLHLTSAAFKSSTNVSVEIDLLRTTKDTSTIGFTIQDNGPGMSESELDDYFQELEQGQHDDEEDWLFATKGSGGPTSPNEQNGSAKQADMTLIARYLRDVNGQIRLSSEPHKGTVFTVEIPFSLAQSTSVSRDASRSQKLRNLFSPSLSSHRGLSPPSPPPSARNPAPAQKHHVQKGNGSNGSSNNSSTSNGHPPQNKSDISSPVPLSSSVRGFAPSRSPAPPPNPAHRESVRTEYADLVHSDPESILTSGLKLNVLVAEDNIVSQKMLEKRIGLRGHSVVVAGDGQEANDRFVGAGVGGRVDLVLMDLKMPGVDGALATRMIRFAEKEASFRPQNGAGQSKQQRVPIIAMSNTLVEDNRFEYIQNGFDGWIMKPIDFQRLDLILQGAKNPETRRDTLYVPGQWEKGGWFFP